MALLVFYVFFAIITGSREQKLAVVDLSASHLAAMGMLAVVIALSLCGSIIPPRRRPPPQFVSSPSPVFCWSEAI